MSTKYELEVLLRPAVEVYSVIVCLCAALLLVIAPGLVLMPPTVAYGCAAVMVLWSIIDARKVINVWRYRVGMRGLPAYFVRSDKIPHADEGLFLGRGFEWEQRHTQRLADTHDSRYRSFATNSSLIVLMFALWRGKAIDGGGNPFIHGVGQNESDLYISNKMRENHTLILGVPGVGKTRDMELFVTQDIHRKPHDTVIVFDPKGDAELLRRIYIEARAAGREKELAVFHLGHSDRSARYNAMESYSRLTEQATRLSTPLPSEGNSSAFKEFAWRFTNVIAKALFSFGETADYDKVRRYINDVEPLFIRVVNLALEEHGNNDLWATRLAELDEETPKVLPRPFTERTREGYLCYELVTRFGNELDSEVAQDLSACFKYDRTYYDKLVSSISPLLEKLTSGKAGKLLSPDYLSMDDPRQMFTWESAIRSRSIVYIGLDALSDTTVSSAVGNSMLSDLVSIAGRIYKQGLEHSAPKGSEKSTGRIWLHFDEINEIAGEEFIPMVNKCRGAGMYVTAYTQAVQDIEARMGSHAKAAQMLGNFGNKIFKRVGNKESAELLTDTLPAVHIASIMAVSGVSDSNDMMGDSHFSSRNEDRISSETVSLLEPASVMQLPIGHSLASTGGGRLLKIRSPLLQDREDDNDIPYDIQSLIDAMAVNVDPGTNWATEQQWWHEDLTHV